MLEWCDASCVFARVPQRLRIPFAQVPIVEPEILIDGSHDIETTARIQERVLTTVPAARPAAWAAPLARLVVVVRKAAERGARCTGSCGTTACCSRARC